MYYFKTKEEADAREKEFYAFIKRTKEEEICRQIHLDYLVRPDRYSD